MQKRINKNRVSLLITAIINVLMLICVILVMDYVQELLNRDVEVNLKEIVTQNQVVINSKLQLELNNTDIASKIIANDVKSINDTNAQMYKNALERYTLSTGDRDFFVADLEGNAYFYEEKYQERVIKYREYFQLAINGKSNIRLIPDSMLDGTPVFIMSVPLVVAGEIKGTVHKFYTREAMYKICELSLFSSKGFMHIIDRDGYVVVQSDNFAHSQGDNRFYRILSTHENAEAAEKLERDVNRGTESYIKVHFEGEEYYSAYTPISGAHNWFLISSISVDEMAKNANNVVLIFYIILCAVVLFAGLTAVMFLYYQKKQNKAKEAIAFVDKVTGGKTFAKFLVEYESIMHGTTTTDACLAVLDIDNFKYVNGFFGYDYGDSLLCRINKHISNKLGKDEICARMSGDHFVLLLQGDSKERLLDFVNVPTDINREIFISAGVYRISQSQDNVNLMLDKASTASQTAKSLLRDKVAYYNEENYNKLRHNEQIKRELNAAIADKQIIPFYQPKVDINTGKIVGAEALARWIKPTGEMISPAQFIPICEKTGQIVDVDFAIFLQVVEFLAANIKNGVECVPISVNFSRLHIMGEDFIHKIVKILTEYDVPTSLLQIELTESIIFDDQKAMVDFVGHMHRHKLVICIDDFGSGYSSLNMLKDIPVDVLKIDKTFLDETADSQRQCLILEVIAQMAKLLSMDVVVEGVETQDNVELMKKLGYNVAQGYYFARPMGETDFSKIFKDGHL